MSGSMGQLAVRAMLVATSLTSCSLMELDELSDGGPGGAAGGPPGSGGGGNGSSGGGTGASSSGGLGGVSGGGAGGSLLTGGFGGEAGAGGRGVDYARVVMASGPIAYWRLGEASGLAAADLTGSYPAVYVGGAILGEPGAVAGDTSITLEGSGQRVDMAGAAPELAFVDAPAFSVEAWVKPTAPNGTEQVILSNRDANNGYELVIDPVLGVSFRCVVRGQVSSASTTGYTPGTWLHAVGTYDSNRGNVRLYVNGVHFHDNQNASTQIGTTASFRIGGRSSPPYQWFDGGVDEVALYGVVLQPSTILEHYEAGRP